VKNLQNKQSIKKYMYSVLPFFIVLGIWWLLSRVLPSYILPSPVSVVVGLLNPRWRWSYQIFITLQEVLIGYAISIILGILLGIIISWNSIIRRMLTPIIVFTNSIPKIAAAPIVLVWFGYGMIPNVVMAFLISFFPILLNTTVGLTEVPFEMIELAKTYNTPKWKIYLKIRIPYSLPYIFVGLKLASLLAVTGAIIGEFIASEKGIAALIMQAQASIETAVMIGALLWIAVMSLVLYGFVGLVQKIFIPWADSEKE